jgi:hypothetical protein
VFKPGHTLLPLTKYGWTLPWDLSVESATNWGYALDIGGSGLFGSGVTNDLNNTNSILYKGVVLATNYPNVFKLSVFTERWYSNLSAAYWTTNGAGEFLNGAGVVQALAWSQYSAENAAPSPEAPQSDLDMQAEAVVQPLHAIAAAIAPHKISMILNGGERGIGVYQQNVLGYSYDSRVAAARGTNWWYYYLSQRKSNELYATYSRLPERDAYIWYFTYEKSRFNQPGYNWERDNANWGWSSSNLLGVIDYSATFQYFMDGGSYTNTVPVTWNNVSDMLTLQLNQVGYNMNYDSPLNYPWVSGGWNNSNSNRLSDLDRYSGFLKCLYTAGALGVNAGYYIFPTGVTPSIFGHNGFTGSFPTDLPPHWLQQIAVTGRVHAQFSWLEDYIRNGALLPGNGNMTLSPANVHAISRDQPSYEFTNTVKDATCRVLARKHNDRDEWLVTAWAAYGDARDVTVDIPTLGEITVTAHPEANIYTATVAGGLKLLDATGQHVGRKVGRADKLRVRRD